MQSGSPPRESAVSRDQNEHRDLAKGALINFIGILAKSFKAVFQIIIAQLYGKEIFGIYLLGFAIVDLVTKLGGLGMDWAMMREVVRLHARGLDAHIRPLVLKMVVLTGGASLVVSLVLAATAPLLTDQVLHKPELTDPLRVLCIGLPFMTMTSVILFAIRGKRKMQYEVLVRSLIEPLALLILGLLAYGLVRPFRDGSDSIKALGVMGLQASASIVAFFASLRYFLKLYPRQAASAPMPVSMGEVLSYSLPMSGMDFLNNLKVRLDLLVVGYLLTPGDVGLFGAVTEIVNLIKKVRQAFEPIFMPIVSFLHEMNDRVRLQRHFALAVRWISMPSFLLLLCMMLVPQTFLRVFGSEFGEGSRAMQYFAIGTFAYVTFGLAESVLSMTNYAWTNLFNSIVLVLVSLALHLYLTPRYGVVGAGLAAGSSLIFISAVRLVQTYFFFGVHGLSLAQLKPLIAGLIAIACAELFENLRIWPWPFNAFGTVTLLIVLYFVILRYAFRLEEEDREILSKLKSRYGRLLSKIFGFIRR